MNILDRYFSFRKDRLEAKERTRQADRAHEIAALELRREIGRLPCIDGSPHIYIATYVDASGGYKSCKIFCQRCGDHGGSL